ncbi:MAG: sodium-dependent transporter [Candidatus Thermoplasmatota archaeon]
MTYDYQLAIIMKDDRERWNSKIGFILATIGSAVGIGNIWRFSSVVGQNGGGAYLIPYLIAVFIFAIPLMILELTIGRYYQSDVITAFRKVNEKFRFLGLVICVVVLLILSYYLVITGWTLGYFISYLTSKDIAFLGFTSSYTPVLYFIVTALITGLVVSLGVKKGIEKVSTILIPFSIIILLVLVFFAFTLDGFNDGVSFLFTPDFSVLSDPLLWGAAFGQAFFSLSVGFGTLITYGSYLDKGVNIPCSSVIITLSDLLVAILAGLTIFPIVFTFGLQPGMGAELAFSTLPKAFEIMAYGQILALLFFLLLFFAALTSAIGMLEVGVAAFSDTTGLSRRRTSLILTVILVFIGLPSALSYTSMNLSIGGVKILDLMDETLGTYGLLFTAFFTSVVFTWFLDKEFMYDELKDAEGWVRIVYPAVKYIIPFVLVVTLISKIMVKI